VPEEEAMARKEPAAGGGQRDGILVVDKPAGITSAGAVAIVKKKLGAGKAGHAGTLDPFAEGVLVCCLNRATRLARFLLAGRKKYAALLELGIVTDTQDATGTVISRRPVDCSAEAVIKVMRSFEGPGRQLPPVYSALKHAGVPLYKLAREGRPFQKPARQIEIYRLNIVEIDLPRVRFEVDCSAGTYIRTLCADIGTALGCGAHLSVLKRTASSGFDIGQAVPLAQVKAARGADELLGRMIGMADAVPDFPTVTAGAALLAKIRHGRPVTWNDLTGGRPADDGFPAAERIKIVDHRGRLVAVLNSGPAGKRLGYDCVFAA